MLVSDERDLPKGSEPVDGTEYDFRVSRTIGATKLDNAFTDLERGEDGRACVRISDPESGASRTLWVDESYAYLMLFTGDTRPDVNRRSLAVEPMTCPPNAFRTGDSLIRLEPGRVDEQRLGDRAVMTRVLILGGGFAGVGAAQKLKDADAEVVLVDRHDYHTFQPLLYQLATGLLETTAVGHSLRDLLERHDNTTIHKDTVTAVDLDARQVSFAELAPISYDYLVFGLGAEVNFFGTRGCAGACVPDVHPPPRRATRRITCSSAGRPPIGTRASSRTAP